MATTPEATAPVRYRDGTAVVDLPPQIDSSAEHALNGAYAAAADHDLDGGRRSQAHGLGDQVARLEREAQVPEPLLDLLGGQAEAE